MVKSPVGETEQAAFTNSHLRASGVMISNGFRPVPHDSKSCLRLLRHDALQG
jgi:hypothetical protein